MVIKIPDKKTKIELEVDQVLKQRIEIISKVFNWTPKKFILYCIKRDLDFIQQYAKTSFLTDLYEHYGIENIDLEELKKLIILTEVK